MKTNRKIEAVIFDCDGVLVDSERLSCGIFAQMMREKGAKVSDEEVMSVIKGSSIEISLAYANEHIPNLDYEKFEAHYRERTFAAFKEQMQPVEGIRELLDDLQLPKAVVSNGPSSKIKLNLEVTKLLSYFQEELIFSGHDMRRFKPDPYMLIEAAKAMKVDPRNCVVIEDSSHGADGARRAGMICYGYTAMTDEAELVRSGAIPFDSMEKIRTILV